MFWRRRSVEPMPHFWASNMPAGRSIPPPSTRVLRICSTPWTTRPAPTNEQVRAATIASLRALMLIRPYRVRGHLEARLDPLGLQIPGPHAELDPRSYGFTNADLDRPIFI